MRRLALTLLRPVDGRLRLDRRGPRPFPTPGGGLASTRGSVAAPAATPALRRRTATRSPARRSRCAARRTGTAAAIPRGSIAAGSSSTSSRSTASRVPRTVDEQFRRRQADRSRRRRCSRAIWCSSTRQERARRTSGLSIGGDEFVHAPSSAGEVRVERLERDLLGRDGSSERRRMRLTLIATWLKPPGGVPCASRPARAGVGELADVQIVLGVEHRLGRRLERLDLARTDPSTACRPLPCSAAGTTGNF